MSEYKEGIFLPQPDLYLLISDSVQPQERPIISDGAPPTNPPELNVDIPTFLDRDEPTCDAPAMFDIVAVLPVNFDYAVPTKLPQNSIVPATESHIIEVVKDNALHIKRFKFAIK